MNIREPSFFRNALGFITGAILAAVAAGLIFVAFVPLGNIRDGRNHAPEAFMLTVLVMFFCGGFIGRRGFSAEALSDLLPSVIGTYAVVVALPLFAGLSIGEALPFVAFASAGVAASIIGSLALLRLFPMRSSTLR